MDLILVLIIFCWCVLGLIAYGSTFGYFQRKYALIAEDNYSIDMLFAAVLAITGPVGFLVSLICSKYYRYGFKWK